MDVEVDNETRRDVGSASQARLLPMRLRVFLRLSSPLARLHSWCRLDKVEVGGHRIVESPRPNWEGYSSPRVMERGVRNQFVYGRS